MVLYRDIISVCNSKAITNAVTKIIEEQPGGEYSDYVPTSKEILLKNSFWNEYRIASGVGGPFSIERVISGIVSYQHFYHNILNHRTKLVWLLEPIGSVEIASKVLAIPLIERMRKIINLPLEKSDGTVNTENAKLILHATKVLMELSGEKVSNENPDFMDMAQIQKRIERLQNGV